MKILLVRSAPLEQCEHILKELINESPEHDITVLTTVTTTGEIVEKYSVRIFNYDARSINLLTVGLENIKRLRHMSFDKVIIACRNHLGDGYGQIKIVAFAIAAPDVELWNVNGAKLKVTVPIFIFRILLWKSYIAVHFLIWCVLIVRDLIRSVLTAAKKGGRS